MATVGSGGDVQVRWSTSAAPEASEVLLSCDELDRLGALGCSGDRRRFRSAHVLVRLLVAEIAHVAPETVTVVQRCDDCDRAHGRPTVLINGHAGPEVSFSHAGRAVIAAVGTGSAWLGIDLEPLGGLRAGLERVALSEEERELLASRPLDQRDDALTRWWVRKEAVLKAAGLGLRTPPDQVIVSPPWQPARVVRWSDSPASFVVADLHEVPGYATALAIRSRRPPTIRARGVDLRNIS